MKSEYHRLMDRRATRIETAVKLQNTFEAMGAKTSIEISTSDDRRVILNFSVALPNR